MKTKILLFIMLTFLITSAAYSQIRIYPSNDGPGSVLEKNNISSVEGIEVKTQSVSVFALGAGCPITSEDNENNYGTGVPDYDMDVYLYKRNSITPIEFNIFVEDASISSATLSLLAWDVDWPSGERDEVYFNGHLLGYLTGANGEWSTTILNIDPTWVIPGPAGKNLVKILVDVATSGSWAVSIDWGQLNINNGCGGGTVFAEFRSVTTPSSIYSPCDQVEITIEPDADPDLYVRVETNILNSDGNIIAGRSKSLTATMGNESFIESFTIPCSADFGNYKIVSILYDGITGVQLDIEYIPITVSVCPDDIVVGNDPGVCGAIVEYITPIGTLVEGLASGALFPVGTTTVTYINPDCSFTVTVNGQPVATPTITPNGPTEFYEGGSVTLTSSEGYSYLWSTGETTRSIVVNTSGNYWVKVFDSNGCESEKSIPVTVKVLPINQGCGGSVLGNTEVYSRVNRTTKRFAIPVTFNESGEINCINIYHNGGTGKVLMGVYTDNNGSPSSLLGKTTTTDVSSSEGWQTVSLMYPASVRNGQKVWLSWVFENNPGVRETIGTPSKAYSSQTYINGMPNSFGWANFASYKYSVYCNYTPKIVDSTIGNTTIYSSSATLSNRLAMPVTFTESGNIQSITIYHNGGTGDVLLGVYSDGATAPATRLGVSASTVINSGAGWQTVPLTSPVFVTSGQTVWLSFVFQTNPGIRYIAGTPSRVKSTAKWSGGMPATFGAISDTQNFKYSLYCTYTTGAATSSLAGTTDLPKSAVIATAITPDVKSADLKVYPNPFSDRLRFEFVSPESVNARIDLYDMTGRLVKNIFEQPIEGGVSYEAEFSPEAIISGIYFYRMTMGEGVYNGKVVFKKE